MDFDMNLSLPNKELPLNRASVGKTLVWMTLIVCFSGTLFAQSVCLPLPRLLSTTPMGGTVGTTFDVTIAGENLEDVTELRFQHPGITAVAKTNDQGVTETNKFTVTIAADCPAGIYEARVLSRLGISSARIFSVGTLPEVLPTQPNTSLATAMALPVNSVCNATISSKAIDFYSFEAQKGHRYIVHCSARGIDSKLDPVVIIADQTGRDLVVERRGNTLDFTAQQDGRHVIKLHELTFKGGTGYFYRLTLQEISADAPIPSFPATKFVRSFSWPPSGLPAVAATQEAEESKTQSITLPCDISGRFYPAADVDTYEFTATAGDAWWVEVASDRLGLNTDPAIVVQQSKMEGNEQKWVDLVELNDIASPVKPSSNGYAYDGPPFDGGSTDILGKLEIKETGTYRILLSDLFGGTRREPQNVYRLVVRKAQPDFAVAAWGLHMELRNGDRNALSKPLALRAGSTVALEVVTVRRDGFDGEIQLAISGLPNGVTAQGLTIPAGKMRGVVLLTAASDAPGGVSNATLTATAVVADQMVTQPVHLAQMAWPIVDSWGEIPSPRLVDGMPVSVTTSETAPITLATSEKKSFDVKAGEKLTLPLSLTLRSEFSGSVLQLKTLGKGLDNHPMFNVNLTSAQAETIIDTAALKTAPGEYTIAFYGVAVPKYRYNPQAVVKAESDSKTAVEQAATAAEELKKQMELAASLPVEKKSEADQKIAELTTAKQAADAAVTAAAAKLKAATDAAAPRDTAEIVISEPIHIRVLP
jgi:hypothetical protein